MIMKTPKQIIVDWIDHARRLEDKDRLKAFWIIRDIVEGMKWITDESITWSADYLRTKCKESPDRNELIRAIESRGRKGQTRCDSQVAENPVQSRDGIKTVYSDLF